MLRLSRRDLPEPVCSVAVERGIEVPAGDGVTLLTDHYVPLIDGPRPTLIAIVGYEDPSTLQLVLEAGAVAVIERPIRPFGLLTNLTIARSIWLEKRETEKRIRKLERKLSGLQRIQKAKAILMDGQGLSEVEAYESIRRQAMAKRLSMDDMAAAIIHANELLQYRAKDV